MEYFTPEEREKIDKELAMVEEEQRKNGNKVYSFDESVAETYAKFGLKLEDFYAYLQNKHNRERSI